jgi:ketosteroid isomerase-like protein
MSEKDVANLRAFLESWDPRGDLDAWKRGEPRGEDLFDPEVAYEDTILPDHAGEVYRGYDGVARATERWLEPFESMTVELEDIVGTGDRLVSIHRIHAVAHHTGMSFDESVAYAWTFRDGRVVHLKTYWDPADALRAAGLDDGDD